MATQHTIITEIYHAGSWAAPEGGPEVEIMFCYRPATRDVWTGPRACPAQLESIEFIEARYTHDKSLLTNDWEDWARDWLGDHEDEAADRAWIDMGETRNSQQGETK